MKNIKRAHHYVWRHFLRGWETDGRLSCRMGGKTKAINSKNLAVENNFYRLPELNENELRYVVRFAESMPAAGQRVFKNFIEMFTFHARLKAALPLGALEKSEIVKAIKTYQANMEEDYHSQIEGRALPILEAIKSDDISFYSDTTQAAVFLYFVATQLLRTKKVRDGQNSGLGDSIGVDLVKVWQIISHFAAANLGGNLFIRRHDDPITLIINDTEVGLITSDQPVVNLYAGSARASKELAVYYPVSPTRAVLFGDLDPDVPIPSWNIGLDQVRRFNRLMLGQSHAMAFARHDDDFPD